MEQRKLILFLLINLIVSYVAHSQHQIDQESSRLFKQSKQLPIQLKFSPKNIKKNTNDSTYIASILHYKNDEMQWDSLKIKMRARGNYRRSYCYYVPLKLKLKKSTIKETIFEDNNQLKLVAPCLPGKNKNDFVIKEYLAYKFYELISPYHFKTRLVSIDFTELRGQRLKTHNLKGILIEDIEKVAKRLDGRVYKRIVHPLEYDVTATIQNNLFQFLIGNTDFSTRTQHNQKLLFIDNKFISIPYDFDMSGLVDTNYAAVSGIENLPTKITKVTQRIYKGYKRDEILLQKVRQEFIGHKIDIFKILENSKELFSEPKQYAKAEQFIAAFFEIIESDTKFNKYIISRTRSK